MLLFLKDPSTSWIKTNCNSLRQISTSLQIPSSCNIKFPIAHTVSTVSFISFPAPCASRVICTTEASSAQPVPYSQPVPYPQLFLIPCHTHTLGCHIPMPREGGDKAMEKELFTHKELKGVVGRKKHILRPPPLKLTNKDLHIYTFQTYSAQ